jgi:hypothetical protein
MTSKEAYLKIQEFINDVQLGIKRSSLDIIEPLNIIRALTKEQSNPTFDECIKEWEDKGFTVEHDEDYLFLRHEQHRISMFINKREIQYHVFYGYITLKLNELLNKTLKALEVIKDE